MHWPAALTEPCSWYCHRETTGACQQGPADVLHGTGAGRTAAAGAAPGMGSRADPAQAGSAATANKTSTAPASEPNTRAPRITTSSADDNDTGRTAPEGCRDQSEEQGHQSSPADVPAIFDRRSGGGRTAFVEPRCRR